jgi:hypothetical protein
MPDLELKRTPVDRHLYTLDGVVTLRLGGLFARSATAEANGETWQMGRRGFWQRLIEASDSRGSAVGQFEPNRLRRGGKLRWRGRELSLRPASSWRQRYALADGDSELAILDGKSWGSRPVKVTVEDLGAIEPGLLLFTAFVVRRLAEDTDTSASAGASAAVSSSG